jgi:sporulation protein YqfC
MRMKRKRREIPALQWVGEVAGDARATILVGSRALIENHAGLIEFTPERIRLRCKAGEIVVSGAELVISDARARSLVVSGKISDIALQPRGGRTDG